jgi:hypothetical protein
MENRVVWLLRQIEAILNVALKADFVCFYMLDWIGLG